MSWQTMIIGGKWADILVPTSPPRFGLIVLHDHDQRTLRTFPTISSFLSSQEIAILCPFGGDAWWADRPFPSFDAERSPIAHLLDEVLPWMQASWHITPPAIGLCGIGLGGQGALRLAFRYPDRFPVVAAVNAAIDHHEWYGRGTELDAMYPNKERCRQDTATLHVSPAKYPQHISFAVHEDSPALRGNDRLHEKLVALGIAHQFDIIETQKKGESDADRMALPMIQFVIDALRLQQRKLI